MLGIGAFLGGRRAGYDGGYTAGFDSAREDGIEKGQELARLDLLPYASFGQRSQSYPVGPLIAARLGLDPSAEIDDDAVRAEMEKLAQELRDEFAPESVTRSMTTAHMERQGFARRRELSVRANGLRHAGIAKYLASKEEDLAVKDSREQP